ncbi:MAG TPA: CBS domain-containing protein [Planctomycetota bacterium]|nr:CBS domain-containing protein [Planctomycetota bacterium]
MNVEELMTKNVKTCGPEDTLEAAARLMWENDCGCVPVSDEQGQALAMLTDRDICMAALTQGRALGEIRVRSAMSGSLHAVAPHETLGRAEQLMQEFQVRRLPVVDHTGRLMGLLSMNDIAREAARERPLRHKAVTSDDVTLTLASVCRPRVCLVENEPARAGRTGAAKPEQVKAITA